MKNIWRVFLFIFIALIIVILTLLQGIRIENLDLPFLKVSQFYIKLDKKLIVSAKEVKINKTSSSATSFSELKKYIQIIPIINNFFDSIAIQKLSYENNTVRMLFKNNIFYVDTTHLTVDSSISLQNDTLSFTIKNLMLKDYDVLLKGVLQTNLDDDKYTFKGKYEISNLKGEADLLLENENLFYRLNTQEFTTLAPFMRYLNTLVKLEPEVNNWIYKYIQAKKYTLKTLEGKFNINTYEFYPQLMKASAFAENLSIKFKKSMPEIKIDKANVILENDTLRFEVDEAEYMSKTIKNPKVHIYKLLSHDSGIVIDLKSQALLDEEIQKILKTFDINIPLIQSSAESNSTLMLDVDFEPVHVKKYSGKFQFKNSYAKLSGLDVFSKSGTILMDNENITFKDVNLKHDDLFDIDFSGVLNTKKAKFIGFSNIENIDIDLKDTKLLHVKNLSTPVSFDIGDNATSISIEKLDANLSFSQNTNSFEIKNVNNIYNYSSLLQDLNITDAKALIFTEDFQTYKADIDIQNYETPFYKDNKNIKNLNLTLDTDGAAFYIADKNRELNIAFDKRLVLNFANMDIKTDLFTDNNTTNNLKIDINAKNSTIYDKNKNIKILNDDFNLKINNQNIDFSSYYKDGSFELVKRDEAIYIESDKLPAAYIDALIGKNAFEGGEFSLHVSGENPENLESTFFIHNSVIKDLKFFNNLMAFINTIPALASFKDPKFNEKGYEVQDGFINFKREGNIVTFKEIKLKGYSADIFGKGTLHVDSENLDIQLQISALKDVSKILKNIPILKNILLGEGDRIYTNITVKGNLDKPEINTFLLEDTILLPVNIIKRTLQAPFKLFE